MPLRVLLGEGDSEIIKAAGSILSLDRVFLVSARDFDPPEKNYLQQQKITLFSSKTIRYNSQSLLNTIVQSNCQNLHIHCDLDAIDPLEFPFVKCPAANGLSIKLLTKLLQQLQSNFNLVGLSITEFAPVKEQGLEKIAVLVQKMLAQFQPFNQ